MAHRAPVVVLLLVAVLTASFGLIGCGQEDTYRQGLIDGRRDGAADAPYFTAGAWGFLFGPFYLIYVAITEPSVPPEVLISIQGKPESYQLGYLEGYKQAKQQGRYIGGAVGWGIVITINLLSGY